MFWRFGAERPPFSPHLLGGRGEVVQDERTCREFDFPVILSGHAGLLSAAVYCASEDTEMREPFAFSIGDLGEDGFLWRVNGKTLFLTSHRFGPKPPIRLESGLFLVQREHEKKSRTIMSLTEWPQPRAGSAESNTNAWLRGVEAACPRFWNRILIRFTTGFPRKAASVSMDTTSQLIKFGKLQWHRLPGGGPSLCFRVAHGFRFVSAEGRGHPAAEAGPGWHQGRDSGREPSWGEAGGRV